MAWADLPPHQRTLLENIGCEQRLAVFGALGAEIDGFYRSAGLEPLGSLDRASYDLALGAWVPALRLVLVNGAHPAFAGLTGASLEAAVASVAWHEWGHALSVHRANDDDVRSGAALLNAAPPGVAKLVRAGSYRGREITHELVANVYALLMARRRRGAKGRPEWLDENLWEIVVRTTEWRD